MTTAARIIKSDWIPSDSFATRIAILRRELGMSRAEFAEHVGLTANQIQGMEDGRSPQRLQEKVQKIHKATGVDREWLMWGGALTSLTDEYVTRNDRLLGKNRRSKPRTPLPSVHRIIP